MSIEKRSITLFAHRTSISLETEFWSALQDVARQREMSLQKLIEDIDEHRNGDNLSSAIRVYLLNAYRPRFD